MELICAVSGGFSTGKFEALKKQAGCTESMLAVLYKRVWCHAQGAKALMQVPKLVMWIKSMWKLVWSDDVILVGGI